MNASLLPPILWQIAANSRGAGMRKWGRGVLGFLAGFVGGAAIALGLCIAAGYLFDIPQSEGAYAMGVAFFWMPLGGLVGGIIGAVWAVRRDQ